MPYTIFVYSVVLILLWLAALCCYYYFPKKIACLTIGFGLGFAWVSLIANIELHQQLPAPLENHPLMITGNIVSLPEIQNDHCRFLFAVDSVCEKQHCHAWHGYVLLRWYYPQQWVHAGERWQFTTRLLRPHSLRNEGNLDYVAWLFSRHIHATGYVYNKKQRQFIEKKMRYAPLATLREKFLEKINLTLQPGSLRGFIKSLVVGDRSELQAHDWDIFRLTGTNHLVVIAGLHIGLLLQVFRMILSLTWRIKPTILLSIPAPMLSGAAGVLLAWSYSLLAGFSIPTQRACWMLCAFLLTLLLRRKVPTWYSFSCAIFLILLFDPLAVIDSSFWLSFNAVGSLAIGMQAHSNHFRQFFSAQWVLMVGMLPLMLWLFQQISFVAWIANMLVIPIVGFLVVPLCLFGGLFSFIHSSIAALLWHLAEKLLLLTFWILEHLAHLPIASWQHGVPYLALLIPGYIGAFLVLKSTKIYLKMIGGLLILLMCFWPAAHPSANELWLTVLDVGQGLAIVVETQNHVLIYDTGLRTGADQDSARSIILPYLQQRQLKIIDKMIISHGDNDHSGGADTLLKTITVKSVLTSVPHRFTPQILCERDQQWAWDGAVFKILSPEKGVPYQKNNSSCVLEINFHEHRFLLPGDIESPVEVSLISLLKPVAVLIAPHHGSRTSSSDNFLKTLHPKLIVVSSGYFNRYHLPHPSIIAKYQQTPTIVMDTAKTGAVTVKVHDNNTLTAENYRSEHLRFWQ